MTKRGNQNGSRKTQNVSKQTKGKPRDKRDNTISSDDARSSGCNDVSWYLANPALIRDVASYPFGWPLGNKVDLHYNTTCFDTNSDYTKWMKNKDAFPGVFVAGWCPTVGYTEDPDNPVNIAARGIYTYVRHVNSGAANYQSTDLMLYLLAMDSVYSWWSNLRRLYGTMMTYSYTNRYFPRTLVTAMGFNYDDIKDNMAQLRAHINQYAVQMASFAVPASMSYMARHQWLNENIYFDSATGKGQTYLYKQNQYFQFEYASDTKLGQLKAVSPQGNMTLADIIQFSQSLINPIAWDEDFNIMSGDILKAFGAGGILKTVDTPPEYNVYPIYNQEVLSQFMNSTAYGTVKFVGPSQTTSKAIAVFQVIDDLTTDTYLKSQPVIEGNVGGSTDMPTYKTLGIGNEDRLVTFNFEGPGAGDTIVATRCTNVLTFDDWNAATIRTASSEVIERYTIYYLGKGTQDTSILSMTFTSYVPVVYVYNKTTGGVPLQCADAFNILALLSNFDWHPAVNVVQRYRDGADGNTDTFLLSKLNYDMNNYTILRGSDLMQMASVIMQNMFAVPLMGAWNNSI